MPDEIEFKLLSDIWLDGEGPSMICDATGRCRHKGEPQALPPLGNLALEPEKGSEKLTAEIILSLMCQLPSDELRRLQDYFVEIALLYGKGIEAYLSHPIASSQKHTLYCFIQHFQIKLMSCKESLVSILSHEKKRKSDRNKAIIGLRDKKKMPFGKIGKALLRIDASWVGKNGRAMSQDAVRKAYYRAKKQFKESPGTSNLSSVFWDK